MKIDDLKPGLELGPSSWQEVRQERIDLFADPTGDHQDGGGGSGTDGSRLRVAYSGA